MPVTGTEDDLRRAAVRALLARVERETLRWVRVVFVDQHGLLRGKTIAASALPSALEHGVGVVSTLLSKDTSGTTVFTAFDADGGLGVAAMAGARDLVMVPDPFTFRTVPWADRTGWVLCDLRFADGERVPFCSRGVFRAALDRAARAGFGYVTGLEIEFHLYHRAGHAPNADGIGRHVHPTPVEPINRGNQLLFDDPGDELEPVLRHLRDGLSGMGVELRTIEIEYGASQLELTVDPALGMDSADAMVVLRSSVKQIARRHGYHATFMCRPQIPESRSSGWHLHQSLATAGENAFVPRDGGAPLSPVGRHFVAGQLHHARAACAFANPTINAYKRFRPHSMAPDRVAWAVGNRGAMIRVCGSAEPESIHIENRIGEPAANPYLYLASQLNAGMLGVEVELPLGPPVDDPYSDPAEPLPSNLGQALDALVTDTQLGAAMGHRFVDYFVALKRAEIARFEATVTDWEHREYFDLF